MKRQRALWAIIALLFGAPAVRGDPSEIKKLTDEWSAARTQWSERAKKDEEAGKQPDMSTYLAKSFRPRFRILAEKNGGKPEAVAALMWLVEEVAGPEDADGRREATWAIQQLAKNHAASGEIHEHLRSLQWVDEIVGQEPMIALYNQVIEKNPDREMKAGATLNLAILHLHDVQEGAVEHQPPRQSALKMARKHLRTVMSDYAGTQAAEQATNYLYELENLQIGMKAPEIVGQDAEGKDIKLSQFAGKVVMLDYWGYW